MDRMRLSFYIPVRNALWDKKEINIKVKLKLNVKVQPVGKKNQMESDLT